jgi:DNA-directed RNA polymerase III subunit RPC3
VRSQRIYESLVQRGPCRLAQLSERTGLNPLQIRRGLALLIQHDLIYWSKNKDTNITTYDANVTSALSLLRFGKIVDLVGILYGRAEQEVVRHLLSLGHVQIADLAQAFDTRRDVKTEQTADNEATTNGHDTDHAGTGSIIESVFHLHEVISRLIQWNILEVVDAESFANPEMVYNEIEQAYAQKGSSAKTAKTKEDLAREKAHEMRAARDRGKELKRKLDSEGPVPDPNANSKRRRLENGHTNGHAGADEVPQRRRVLDVSAKSCRVSSAALPANLLTRSVVPCRAYQP